MKVVLIEPAGKEGIAHYTHNLANALANKGLDVMVLTNYNYELDGLQHKFKVEKVFKGFSLHHVFGNYHRMLSQIKRFKPDVIHYQWPPFPWLDILFLKSTNVKKVYTVHDVLPLKKRIHHKLIFKLLYESIDKLIVHSKSDRKQITELGVKSDKIKMISHGNYDFLNLPIRFDLREKFSIGEGKKIILFFGAIRENKGLDILLKAYGLLKEKNQQAVLMVAGEPKEDFSKYDSIIKELDLKDIYLDLRFIPYDEISSYVNAADVIALPYKSISTSGIIHLAYGFGKPVVASDVGNIGEVVVDGETGYKIPPGDIKKLAQSIEKLLDGVVTSKMTENIINQDREYSWDNIAKETVRLYENGKLQNRTMGL